MSCGAHTDCGFLTLLCATGGDGLQVQTVDGTWLAVDSRPEFFICNIGDLAARWTNDVYRSTPHRVLNESTEVRRSIIFFNNLDADAQCVPLPSCVSEQCPGKYEPVTCGDYVAKRLGFMRKGYKGDAKFKGRALAEPERASVVQA